MKKQPTAKQGITITPHRQVIVAVPRESWWLQAPREGFTATCAAKTGVNPGVLLKDHVGSERQ